MGCISTNHSTVPRTALDNKLSSTTFQQSQGWETQNSIDIFSIVPKIYGIFIIYTLLYNVIVFRFSFFSSSKLCHPKSKLYHPYALENFFYDLSHALSFHQELINQKPNAELSGIFGKSTVENRVPNVTQFTLCKNAFK